ncbi:hypothetical protein ES703_87331 [subsurface metagenome]
MHIFLSFALNRPVKQSQIQYKLFSEKCYFTFRDPDVSPLQFKTNLLVVATPEEHTFADKNNDIIAKITALRYQRPKLG